MKIKPTDSESCAYNPTAQYPCGTSIELEGELAVGAGYDKFKAGDMVEVRCIAYVKQKSERSEKDEGEGEIKKRLCLQLTDIETKKTKADVVKQLYGNGK